MKTVGGSQTQVKLFAQRRMGELEREINDWLSTNAFEQVEFQYTTDLTHWTCLAVYVLKPNEDVNG